MDFEPVSIFPAVPVIKQFEMVHSSLDMLATSDNSLKEYFTMLFNSHRISDLEPVLGKKSESNGFCYWIIDNIEIIILDLGIDCIFNSKLALINQIRENLKTKRVSWVYLITSDINLIFTLLFDQFLIWSRIQEEFSSFFFASIVLDVSMLNNFTPDERDEILKTIKKRFGKLASISTYDTTEIVQHYPQVIEWINEAIQILSNIINNYIRQNVTSKHMIDLHTAFTSFSDIEQRVLSITQKDLFEVGNSFFKNIYTSLEQSADFWILDLSKPLLLESYPLFHKKGKTLNLGSYYTPLNIAAVLVNNAFKEFDLSKIPNPKILDPAMGTGVILAFALEWLVNHKLGGNPNISFQKLRQETFKNCINGNDIDKTAVKIAEEFFQHFCFGLRKIESFPTKFTCFDFIASFLKNSTTVGNIDLILTNPPYIPFHSRFAKNSIKIKQFTDLKKEIPAFTGIRDNLYLIFIGISLKKYLSPSGLIGIVLDRSFLDLPSYKKIREYLTQFYDLRYILGNYDFKTTATVDLSLLILANERKVSQFFKWQDNIASDIKKIPIKILRDNEYNAFRYSKPSSFLSRLKEYTTPLGEILEIRCGLEYGALLNPLFLSAKKHDQSWFPVIDGANSLSFPYVLFWIDEMPNSYVRFDKIFESQLKLEQKNYSVTGKKVLLISGELRRFLQPKIIIRQTSDKFIACFDSNQYLTLRNTHVLYSPRFPYSLNLILGILNSCLGNWIGENLNIIRKGGTSRYPQIRVRDLMRFPIVNITANQEEVVRIEKLVKEANILGIRISNRLSEIWYKIRQDPTMDPKGQKYYLRKCFDNSIYSMSNKQTKEYYTPLITKLRLDLERLSSVCTSIDSTIIDLYGLNNDEILNIRT